MDKKELAFKKRIEQMNHSANRVVSKKKNTLETRKNGELDSKEIWEETLYNHLSSFFSKITIDECWLIQYFNQKLRPYDRFDIAFSFSGSTDFHLIFLIGDQIKVTIDDEIRHHHEIIHKEAAILIRESINSIKKLLPIYYPENRIRYVTGMIPFTYDSLTEELLQKENQ